MKISVIIPSLNPDDNLVEVVDALIAKGFEDIIVVNDGSDDNHLKPFEKVSQYKQCTILTHEINKGKGRGLKTAFRYCIENRKDILGVVTVDGDNQHKADDIYNCSKKMIETGKVILGARRFNGKDVPFKSRFGNNLTSGVFRVLFGLKISDTQTGLRAIPVEYLESFCEVSGERFEYETNMLLSFKTYNVRYSEVPIETIYDSKDNHQTHFNPVKDSIRIYKVIFKYFFSGTAFKYLLSSVASWVIDNALFNIFDFLLAGFSAFTRISISTAIARVASSIFNFAVNRKAVFKSEESIKSSIIKYYILCAGQLCVSALLVFLVTKLLSLSMVMTAIAKIIIDIILFFASYRIQKMWVFKK